MMKALIAVAILASAPALAQNADGYRVQTVHAGKPTRIYTWHNCRLGKMPTVDSKVEVGQVERREALQNKCGSPQFPVAEYFYTAPASFRGETSVFFYRGRAVEQKRLMVVP